MTVLVAVNPNLSLIGERLEFLLWAVFVVLTAIGLGGRLLGFFRLPASPAGGGEISLLERGLTSFGLGLGVFSLVTLLLGLAGLLVRLIFFFALIAFLLLGLKELLALFRGLRNTLTQSRLSLFSLILVAFLALFFVLLFLAAFIPPLDYDDLEYHLGAPAQFFKAGRINFLKYNVYSNFPFNAEMLYLLSMTLLDSSTSGAILGKIINVFFALLTALVIYAFGRRFFSSRAGLVGAAVFFISPWTLGLCATRAYVEMGLAFYTILAIYSLFIYGQSRGERGGARWLALSGIFVGIAMGYKYPAALFLAFPLLVGTLFFTFRRGARKALSHAALFLTVAFLVFSPWLIKNFYYTKNPTYPLFFKVFGSNQWDGQRDARWRQAHSPGRFGLDDLGSRVGWFLKRVGKNSPGLLVFIPFAFLTLKFRRESLYLLSLIVFSLLVWFYLTHRIDRFLFPVLPVAAVLSGCGFLRLDTFGRGLVAKVILFALLIFALFATFQIYPVGGLGIKVKDERAVAKWFDELFAQNPNWNYPAPAINYINNQLPQDAKVLLVGEAATFYIRRKFISSTVFDQKPLEEMLRKRPGPEKVAGRLQASRITHIFCNWREVERLNSTYAYQFRTKKFPGYSAYITREVFDGMEAAGIIEAIASFGPYGPPRPYGRPGRAVAAGREKTGRAPFVLYKLVNLK